MVGMSARQLIYMHNKPNKYAIKNPQYSKLQIYVSNSQIKKKKLNKNNQLTSFLLLYIN